jgi:hypothetical protein
MDPIDETVIPVDAGAVDLRFGCVETLCTAAYDDVGTLVSMPRWRVHCIRVEAGEPLELWSITVPVEPPPLPFGQRVTALRLRARYWTARTRAGWAMSAVAITAVEDDNDGAAHGAAVKEQTR